MLQETQTIRVGVIGLGRAGWDLHVKPLAKHPDFSLAAVVDPEAERRRQAEEEFGVQAFATRDEMLWAGGLDAVVVASPTMFHFPDAEAVLARGLHCILEKPMTADLSEAKSLVVSAERSGRCLMVHHIHLFRPLFHHLQKTVIEAAYGNLVECQFFWGGYQRRTDWQALRKHGGGLLANYGSHFLSIVLPLLDAPVEKVDCEVRNIKDTGDTEDHVWLRLETPSGQIVRATLTTVAALPKQQIILMGPNGTLVTDGKNSTLKFFDSSVVQPAQVSETLAAVGRKYCVEELPWETREIVVSDDVQAPKFYDEVALAIRGGAPSPVLDLGNSLEVMRVLEMARVSAGIA